MLSLWSSWMFRTRVNGIWGHHCSGFFLPQFCQINDIHSQNIYENATQITRGSKDSCHIAPPFLIESWLLKTLELYHFYTLVTGQVPKLDKGDWIAQWDQRDSQPSWFPEEKLTRIQRRERKKQDTVRNQFSPKKYRSHVSGCCWPIA